MGQLVFQATLGGQVALAGPNTASSYTLNLPTVNGNVVSTGDTATVTNTMLATNVYTAPGTIGSGTANTGAFTTLTASTSVLSPIHGSASGSLSLQSAGTTAVTIDTSQNVGIGTTTPGRKLTALSSTDTPVQFASSGANAYIQLTGSADVYLGSVAGAFTTTTGGSERMRIDSSGNVGIGNASPGYKLDVASSASTQLSLQYTGVGRYLLGCDSGFNLIFSKEGTGERMRIDSSGRVCINNTTSTGGQPLYVKALAGVGSAGLQVSANGSGAIDWYNVSGTYVASVIVNASTVAYNTTSDYRLKDNIAPMTGALDKVNKLNPVNWKWKIDGSNSQGFIAHELAEIVPECVSGEKDAVDAEGNPVYQGVDTSFLVATLTAAIQEQQALITSLTARIETLEIAQPKTTTS